MDSGLRKLLVSVAVLVPTLCLGLTRNATASALCDPLQPTTCTIGELADQLGIRFGGGVEYAVSRNAAFTLSGDYLVPLIDAEDSTGLFELSTSGFAIRLGIRFVL